MLKEYLILYIYSMKRHWYLFLLFFGFYSMAFGQGYSVGLVNGKVIESYNIRLKNPLFKRPFILVNDSLELELDGVDYYTNYQGDYVVRNITFGSRKTILNREINGPISLFYIITQTGGYYDPTFGYTRGRERITYYFEKEKFVVQRLNFENLFVAVQDNPQSLEKLMEAQKIKRTNGLMYAAGAGLLVAGIMEGYNSQGTTNQGTFKVSPFFIAGLVVITIPQFRKSQVHRKYIDAILIYNDSKINH